MYMYSACNVMPHSDHVHLICSRQQMDSSECDIITGFYFEDSSPLHVLMLEGLRERGVSRLWTELPHHHTQGTHTNIYENYDSGNTYQYLFIKFY